MKSIILLFSCLFFINSNAQFGEQQIITTDAMNAWRVFATDLDGDGHQDIFHISSNDNKLAWYKNTDGLGNFGEQQIIDLNITLPRDAFAADIDGDGDKDIVLISSNPEYVKKLAWYENTDGLGSFAEAQIISIDDFSFENINPADIDGDGDVDIVSSTFEKLVWFENLDGLGNFSPRIILLDEEDMFRIDHNFPIDMDDDGDMDVISAGYHDNIEWFENLDGLGNFGEPQLITIGNLVKLKDIHAADLDGDGDIDVLSASRDDDKIAWYENLDGQGTFGEQKIISETADYAFSVYTADIDNDGDQDVLAASWGEDKIVWYENLEGTGNFGEENLIAPDIEFPTDFLAVDLNGDNKIDVVSTSDNKIIWFENLITLGVNEFTNDSIILLPNPVSTILTIENNFTSQIESIKIYDVLGKLVLEESNPSSHLDVSNLDSGLLFVQLATDNGIITKKIIKE